MVAQSGSEITLPTLDTLNARLPTSLDAKAVASAWFKQFAKHVEAGDAPGTSALFLEDSFWRDHLALTWEFRTFHGSERIVHFLADVLASADTKMTNLKIEEDHVELQTPYPDLAWIEAFFTFETSVGLGSGVVRIVPVGVSGDSDRAVREWKAHTVYTSLEALKNHPERLGALRSFEKHQGGTWSERRRRELNFEDPDVTPAVVVVGAGQSGLDIAARLKCLDVPTLLVEKLPRVGDQWRGRYESLYLHDPVWLDHLPYLPFPPTWPVWTPAPKLADWLEAYANLLDLNVWTGATIDKIEPIGNVEQASGWTVYITRSDGQKRVFKPRHVVFAHGLFGGVPNMPTFPGMEKFEGKIIHSSQHRTAREHEGKKVVVVGACTSSHDICYDHAVNDVDVTMVQRGSTYIMSLKNGIRMLNEGLYWEGSPPTEVADRKNASFPLQFVHVLHKRLTKNIADADHDLLQGLKNRGFKYNMGEEGSGIMMLWMKRGGGYYFDTGASEMIISGKIKLKNDSLISHFSKDGVVFEDGSKLPAEVVVLATGYKEPKTLVRALAGEEIAGRVNRIWGLNDEGEPNSVWRWSGMPRLYFMMGNLSLCRYYSKHLALQIKAQEVGLYGKRYTA